MDLARSIAQPSPLASASKKTRRPTSAPVTGKQVKQTTVLRGRRHDEDDDDEEDDDDGQTPYSRYPPAPGPSHGHGHGHGYGHASTPASVGSGSGINVRVPSVSFAADGDGDDTHRSSQSFYASGGAGGGIASSGARPGDIQGVISSLEEEFAVLNSQVRCI